MMTSVPLCAEDWVKTYRASESLASAQLTEGCERPREVGDKLLADGELLSVAAGTLVLVYDKQGVAGASLYLADDKLAVADDKLEVGDE